MSVTRDYNDEALHIDKRLQYIGRSPQQHATIVSLAQAGMKIAELTYLGPVNNGQAIIAISTDGKYPPEPQWWAVNWMGAVEPFNPEHRRALQQKQSLERLTDTSGVGCPD